MEAVEDLEGAGRFAGDHLQVRVPHVRADEAESGAALGAEPAEEPEQRLRLAILPDPEQPAQAGVDLVDDGEELVALVPQHFIHPDGGHVVQRTVRQSPRDGHLDGAEHALPGGVERVGNLGPTQALRPAGQKPRIRGRRVALALGPGHRFHHDAARRARDPAHRVDEVHGDAPERNELEASRPQCVVARASSATSRTPGTSI